MALNSDNLNILALISTVDLAANEIFYHTSCYKSMQYKSDKFKRDKSLTDQNAEWKKIEALDRVVLSHIIEHEEFNPGSVYVVKDINQKFVEYLSELRVLEQPNTTRFTEKLLLALPKLCSKTLVKDDIKSPDDFLLHYERLYFLYQKNFLSRRAIFQMN